MSIPLQNPTSWNVMKNNENRWEPQRFKIFFFLKCFEEDSVRYYQQRFSAPRSGPNPFSRPHQSRSDPFSSYSVIALRRMEGLDSRVSERTVFWAWTIWEASCRGSRRLGRAVELGPGRGRLLAEVTRVRRQEGLESSVSKVVRLHYDVVCPSEGLRTPSASRFRWGFIFSFLFLMFIYTFYHLFDCWENEGKWTFFMTLLSQNSHEVYRNPLIFPNKKEDWSQAFVNCVTKYMWNLRLGTGWFGDHCVIVKHYVSWCEFSVLARKFIVLL